MSRVRSRLRRITVTVPVELVRLADRLARSNALSRSAVLSEALRRHVGAQPPAPGRDTVAMRSPVAVPAEAHARPVGPARVAEPVTAPYPMTAPSDLAFASDADLLAEVQRRLTDPGRRVRAEQILNVDRARLADLCRRHHITRLSLFGSVLRDDFRPDSDVDVLVEFEEGKTPGFGFFEIQDELSTFFGGRRVDLVTRAGLNLRLRGPILDGEHVLYDAG